MLLRRSFLLLVILGLAAVPRLGRATPAASPAAFVNTLVNEAIALIKNHQLSPAERNQKFSALLNAGFDVPRIARFVLGRYYRGASQEERDRFTKDFAAWIVQTYASRFRDYSGETVKVTGTRPINANTSIVQSQIIRPNAPPTRVDWRVSKEGDDYKLIDVEVEGVSMAVTQRDEFTSVIDQHGGTVAGLNQVLEQKLASGGETRAAH